MKCQPDFTGVYEKCVGAAVTKRNKTSSYFILF